MKVQNYATNPQNVHENRQMIFFWQKKLKMENTKTKQCEWCNNSMWSICYGDNEHGPVFKYTLKILSLMQTKVSVFQQPTKCILWQSEPARIIQLSERCAVDIKTT